MRHRLKMAIVLGALQLFASMPAFGEVAPEADGLKASERRPAMAQGGGTRRGRRRAADPLMPGVWGGPHIRFEVTESGARVEYDCAHGTVEGQIVVDAQGRFNVYGMHYEERGGPVRSGGEAAGYRVRLSGRVGGSLLKLTVTRPDTKESLGTFTLRRDAEAELFKCR